VIENWEKHEMLTTHRPIGVVGGSVNKANQTAAEIVAEMVKETEIALNSAALFINPASKL
jgi:hypothetical protein